jgi:hypothetical protein
MVSERPYDISSTPPASRLAQVEKRQQPRVPFIRRTAPCWRDEHPRLPIRPDDEHQQERELLRRRHRQLHRAIEYGSGLGEWVDEQASSDARQFVQAMVHRRDDTEVPAAATQRPEQVRFHFVAREHDAAIGEHHLRGEQVVERQAEAGNQGTVPAAGASIPQHPRSRLSLPQVQPQRIRQRDHVGCTSAARNLRASMIGGDYDAAHAGEVDHNAVAERATGPIVATAAHGQRHVELARGEHRGLHILARLTVHDRAWAAADWLGPDRGSRRVAFVTWSRDAAGQSCVQVLKDVLEGIRHLRTPQLGSRV